MRKLIVTFGCIFCVAVVHAQSPNQYFNTFQDFYYTTPNVDSALYYVEKLASNEKWIFMLRDLVHNSFAQSFRPYYDEAGDTAKLNKYNRQLAFAKHLLTKMAFDTSLRLKETVWPLYLLNEVQEAEGNQAVLTGVTDKFISTQLANKDIYVNRAGRYGLLMYQILPPALAAQKKQLLSIIKASLKNNQVPNADTSTRQELDKRAWYRYLYAYVHFMEAGETNDLVKKKALLKTAFDYSQDLTDKNHMPAFFYDMIMLLPEEKYTFRDDYLNLLMNSPTGKNNVLPILLQTALIDPDYKSKLEAYYRKNNTASFNDYWLQAINKSAKPAPAVEFTGLDKKLFSSKQLQCKWLLVDFWGTWCGPCRQEHPAMQKFYDSVVLRNTGKIAMLTIACKDTEDKVNKYMAEKKYSFPVAMADNVIEKTYQVQGYPTKILITPQGRYIVIPYNVDWAGFIKQYSNL